MSVTTRAVLDDELDLRLDRWFRRHYPALTQGAIQKMCRTGQVRVDGKRVEGATRLAPGQSVRIPPLRLDPLPEIKVQPVDPKARRELDAMVLFEDDYLLVLNKPAGLPSQGGTGIARHLDGMLEAYRGPGGRPRLVHRLDRDTTGVIVVARTAGVAAKLAAAFRTRAVEKTYWAVVAGRPVPVEGRVDLPLVKLDGPGGERMGLAKPGDREVARAYTDYRTLDHAARKLAWLELRPLTGRTHQLRVHCASLGTPILGDYAYGERRENNRNSAIVENLSEQLHLHARRLMVPHPDGGVLTVEAGLPTHMAETFRDLGFDAPPALAPVRR